MRLSAVYLYDRVLTSGQEIAVIWTRKMGLLAIIYTLMHVFTFLELLWYVLSYMNTPCRVSASVSPGLPGKSHSPRLFRRMQL